MRASLLIILADPLFWTSFWHAKCEDSEFSSARTYVLNPLRLSWAEAADACRELGGTLATIRKFSTLPTIDLEGDWTFWIGLTKNEDKKWIWMDSSEVTWSNWRTDYLSGVPPDDPCSVAVTMLPYWWDPRNCSIPFPSLCELQEGECSFVRFNHSSIISNNMRFESKLTLEECRTICEEEKSFVCRSFEYNSKRRYCQLSSYDRYMSSITFTQHDAELDYYHRTCDYGRLRDGFTVSPIGIVTGELLTTPNPTTTESSPEGLFCTQLRSINPNTTEPLPEEVQELKSMNVVFKARQTSLKKTSVADYRPSANYVGSSAVIIAFSLIGSVVICDIVSLFRHCILLNRKLRRNRKKHKRYQLENRDELKITDHMNAVTRHMQFLSQTNIPVKSNEENGDCLKNVEVLSVHSFSRLNNDDGSKIQNGSATRDKKSRAYDWSDDEEPREILEIELKFNPEDAKPEEDDLDKSTNSSKYIYRTYYSTDL